MANGSARIALPGARSLIAQTEEPADLKLLASKDRDKKGQRSDKVRPLDIGAIKRMREKEIVSDTAVQWSAKILGIVSLSGFPGTKISTKEAEMLDALGLKEGPDALQDFGRIHKEAMQYSSLISVKQSPNIANTHRHSYWSARLAQRFGAEWADQYTTAHERNTTGQPLPPDRIRDGVTDLHNNGVGIWIIARQHPNASPTELKKLIDQAFLNGKLLVHIPEEEKIVQSSLAVQKLEEAWVTCKYWGNCPPPKTLQP